MRATDIVRALADTLPLYTDGFSTSVEIAAATLNGTTLSVDTVAPHGLARDGQEVALRGLSAPVQIDPASFSRVGSSATFRTLQDHDLTLSQRDRASGGKTVTLSGAAESEYMGEFELLSVPSRRQVVISVPDTAPATISGAPLVDDGGVNIFNVIAPATITSPASFTLAVPSAYPLSPVVEGASVATSLRIASVLSVDEYLQDVYTKKAIGEDVIIVQLGDVSQSKSRDEETDASTSSSGEYAFNATLLQPFAVYVVQNVTDQLTATAARDKIESEYVPAVFKSLLRRPFDTGFTYSSYRATFTGHGVYAYFDVTGKNKAIYAHEISFQQIVQIDRADTYAEAPSVAMRDVSLAITTNIGTGELTASVDLDEQPEEG